jgi:hypothetical protein
MPYGRGVALTVRDVVNEGVGVTVVEVDGLVLCAAVPLALALALALTDGLTLKLGEGLAEGDGDGDGDTHRYVKSSAANTDNASSLSVAFSAIATRNVGKMCQGVTRPRESTASKSTWSSYDSPAANSMNAVNVGSVAVTTPVSGVLPFRTLSTTSCAVNPLTGTGQSTRSTSPCVVYVLGNAPRPTVEITGANNQGITKLALWANTMSPTRDVNAPTLLWTIAMSTSLPTAHVSTNNRWGVNATVLVSSMSQFVVTKSVARGMDRTARSNDSTISSVGPSTEADNEVISNANGAGLADGLGVWLGDTLGVTEYVDDTVALTVPEVVTVGEGAPVDDGIGEVVTVSLGEAVADGVAVDVPLDEDEGAAQNTTFRAAKLAVSSAMEIAAIASMEIKTACGPSITSVPITAVYTLMYTTCVKFRTSNAYPDAVARTSSPLKKKTGVSQVKVATMGLPSYVPSTMPSALAVMTTDGRPPIITVLDALLGVPNPSATASEPRYTEASPPLVFNTQ